MSVAAVKVYEDRIIIGADSQLTLGDGSHKKEVENAKIWEGNNIIVAGAGEIYEFSLFVIYCKANNPIHATDTGIFHFFVDFVAWKTEKLQREEFKLDCSYLFIFGKKAFLIDEDFYIKEINTYQAIGAGMTYAEAALYLGHSVDEALKVACRLSPDCEEPLTIFTIKKD
jgi:ATP-dependent protease HslVU (ClpYQ) peptidase subunit